MKPSFVDRVSDKLTTWIGSTSSIVVHTIIFIFAFASHWVFGWSFDFILLVLTTVVSLEAIYLAIFIQRSVNQQADRLEDVEESLDEVEESIDEVERSLDEVEEQLDDTDEDIAKIALKTATKTVQRLEKPLDEVVAEIRETLAEIQEMLKNKTK